MNRLKYFLLTVFFFPAFLCIVNLGYSHQAVYLESFLKSLSVTAVLFIPLIFLRKYARAYTFTVSIFIYAATVLNIVHMAVYKSELTKNGIYAVFDTNSSEAFEYIAGYFSWDLMAVLAVATFIPFYVLILKKPAVCFLRRRVALGLVAVFLLINVLGGVKDLKFITRMADHPFVGLVIAFYSYKTEKTILEKASEKLVNDVSVTKAVNTDIVVVAVGESLTTKHMQLYGYERETNPLLTARKESLIIFNDARTQYFSTIPSLTAAFAYKNEDRVLSLFSILNSAGYETHWISNQAALGVWETMFSMVVKPVQRKLYLNNSNGGVDQSNLAIFDEKLIEPAIAKAAESSGSDAVFIHMLGSHSLYSSRYPTDFDFFKDKSGISDRPWLTKDKQYKKINEYDNSVRYNDFVIAEMIEKLDALNKSVIFIYFADHGESVYDDGNFAGHTDSGKSKYTGKVPMVIWASSEYRTKHPDVIAELSDMATESFDIAEIKSVILEILGVSYSINQ